MSILYPCFNSRLFNREITALPAVFFSGSSGILSDFLPRTVISILGLIYETVADFQLFNFKRKKDENKILKVGILAPLTGQYEELGNSLLYSLQLALSEIDDENVFIIPRDAGFNNKEKLRKAIQSLEEQNLSILIAPISYQDFDEAKKFSNITFISPSNIIFYR